MLKNYRLVHYYGEFGYFNFILLGYLEKYFSKNSTHFLISTYPDYFSLLDAKFPRKFAPGDSFQPQNRDAKRQYHRIQDEEFNAQLARKGYQPLDVLLGCDIADWREGRMKISPISRPFGREETVKPYISITCRKRLLDIDRNLSLDRWMEIIQTIRLEYPTHQLVFHGLRSETVEVPESRFCEDILDSVKYLNQSLFFVSSMSGFAQFASNCACSILQIGPPRQMIPYNPFSKTNLQIEREGLESLQYTIQQFRS